MIVRSIEIANLYSELFLLVRHVVLIMKQQIAFGHLLATSASLCQMFVGGCSLTMVLQ